MAAGSYYGWDRKIWTGLSILKLSVEEVLPSDNLSKCRVCCEGCVSVVSALPLDQGFICSHRCLRNFWADVTQTYFSKSGGVRICLFPGCTSKCYAHGEQVFDYCSKVHKFEHLQLWREDLGGYGLDMKICRLPECRRVCSVNVYGIMYDYCCIKHSKMDKQRTIICGTYKCQHDKSPILFYNSSEPYYEFSNFYEFAPFELDDRRWKSSEHYFQAQKFIGTPYEEYIRLSQTPRKAFELARERTIVEWRRDDWEDVKLFVMYKALLAKFSAHERLRLLLHSTKDRKLVEHTTSDSYWGDGGEGKGLNWLGRLLEDVRLVLRGKDRRVLTF